MIRGWEGIFVVSPTVRPQSSKVSHPGPAVIHPNRSSQRCRATLRALGETALIHAMPSTAALAAAVILAVAPGIAAASAGATSPFDSARTALLNPDRPGCLLEPAGDAGLLVALDRMYRMEYVAADSAFAAALPAGSPGRDYFRGLNLLHRFVDRGDAWALSRAESLWTALSETGTPDSPEGRSSPMAPLYRGLSTLQLSYAANLRGERLRALRLGRKAAGQLEPLRELAEAGAALALYDYYKAALLKGVDWLPFVEADPEGAMRRLETAVSRSRYLREALQTSLIWLYYDARRLEEGMALIDGFLARYPANRTYRQIRGDFLFRRAMYSADSSAARQDLVKALDIHDSLLAEYGRLQESCPPPECIPTGYLSAVGNQVKIHARLGHPDLRRKHIGIWSSSKFAPYLSWLPESLRREVDSQRK